MDMKWDIEKIGRVHTDVDGRTCVAVILGADDAVILPEEGDEMEHVSVGLDQSLIPSGESCPLSDRETECLEYLSEGLVYKQIAAKMHLSVSTVRTHLHNVYGKIGVADRAQAVLMARDKGWI